VTSHVKVGQKKLMFPDSEASSASIIRVNVTSNCRLLIHISLTSTLVTEAEQVTNMFVSDSILTKLIAQADSSAFVLSKSFFVQTENILNLSLNTSKMHTYPTSEIKKSTTQCNRGVTAQLPQLLHEKQIGTTYLLILLMS
jgi:hypothetical protein